MQTRGGGYFSSRLANILPKDTLNNLVQEILNRINKSSLKNISELLTAFKVDIPNILKDLKLKLPDEYKKTIGENMGAIKDMVIKRFDKIAVRLRGTTGSKAAVEKEVEAELEKELEIVEAEAEGAK